ncbi:MAG: hypothetical protein AMXMBFR58_23410 [Phycisphaerae bacterium]
MKLLLLAATLAGLCMAMISIQPEKSSKPAAPAGEASKPSFRILVFSKTAGFRHDSIPDGIAAIQKLGKENGFDVDATEDAALFTEDNLGRYAAVLFLSTTGDVLDDDQQKAFEAYIAKGRGFVGVHAAADTEYEWPWFGTLVGAYFKSHPKIQDATNKVEDRTHPSTHHLAEEWKRHDEWYTYKDNPRSRVHVLISLDESTYEGGGMDGDHPIAWCNTVAGGRSWYTGGGHTKESFTEPDFLKHLLGGIKWAAGVAPWTPVQPAPTQTADN